MSSERAFYSRMFPGSNVQTNIRCGHTKAEYVCTKAIAPWVREQYSNILTSKRFTVHVDETTYNQKTRLEIWIAYYCDRKRVSHYLSTVELECEIDLEAFLNDGYQPGKIKMCNAEKITEGGKHLQRRITGSCHQYSTGCSSSKKRHVKELECLSGSLAKT